MKKNKNIIKQIIFYYWDIVLMILFLLLVSAFIIIFIIAAKEACDYGEFNDFNVVTEKRCLDYYEEHNYVLNKCEQYRNKLEEIKK